MDSLIMAVYLMSRDDGSPWKNWCYVPDPNDNNLAIVRFGGFGDTLQQRKISISKDAVNQKLKEGYVFQGNFSVTDTIGQKTSAQPIQQAQTVTTPMAQKLVSWAVRSEPVDSWADKVYQAIKYDYLGVTATYTPGETHLEIKEIGYTISISRKTSGFGGRGFIEKGNHDVDKLVILLLAARESGGAIKIVDDASENISMLRFQSHMKHLQFDSGKFSEFMEKAAKYGVVRSGEKVKMKGASAFF